MKTVFNSARRKRIRTRKSLNELRNRSRRLVSPETKPTTNKMGNLKRNHFVTSDRLTLAMFPNAIRSETVTRLGNDEVKNKLTLNFQDLIQNNVDIGANNEEENGKLSDSGNSNQSVSDDEQRSDLDSDSEGIEVANGGCNVMHSSPPSTQAPPLTDNSPPVHCLHDQYYHYEQFMSNLSTYIKQTVAKSVLTDKVVDNLKGHLYNLTLQANTNIMTLKRKPSISKIHISHVSEDMVVEEPMDYIRLSYSATENTPAVQTECTSTSNSADSLLHINSPQLVSSSSRTDLSDTPEYIYFPHKLN